MQLSKVLVKVQPTPQAGADRPLFRNALPCLVLIRCAVAAPVVIVLLGGYGLDHGARVGLGSLGPCRAWTVGRV